MTLEQFILEYLGAHPSASISAVTEAVLKAQAKGKLDDDEQMWMEKAQRRGLELEIEQRFRKLFVKINGISVRRIVASLDEDGETRWLDLEASLADPEKVEAIRNQAWLTIRRAVGMIREHRLILLSCGEPTKLVDAKIATMVKEALRKPTAEVSAD
jgi:hypothetical protein